MSRFRFSLEVLLDLRQRRRDERARELAEANARLADAERERDALVAAQAAARAHMAGGGPEASVGRLRAVGFVLAGLDAHLAHADRGCVDARKKAEASLQAYGGAVAEHRSVDRLRERHLDDWRGEQDRLEQRAMDETALSRHARAASAGNQEAGR